MRYKIEPNIILTVDYSSGFYISYIVKDKLNNILDLSFTTKDLILYNTRKNLINHIKELYDEFNIDMLILEENKLFTDTISKYPDPYILRNILLGYGIQTSIEDNFFEIIKYIIYLPEYEWTSTILNKKAKFTIDNYKFHVLNIIDLNTELLNDIEKYNHYKVICLSQCIEYQKFMNSRYWVNKKNNKE